MSGLGLDALTDDQIVELVREIAAEMASRHSAALVDAATRAMQEEVDKAKEGQDAQWATRAWLGRMVVAAIGDGWGLTVWRRGDDLRVYLDGPKGHQKWTLYVTGNRHYPPGDLRVFAREVTLYRTGEDLAGEEAVRAICEEAARLYPQGDETIWCTDAARSDYDVPPFPPAVDAAAARREQRERWRAELGAETTRAEEEMRGQRPSRALSYDEIARIDAMRAANAQELDRRMAEYDARIGEDA